VVGKPHLHGSRPLRRSKGGEKMALLAPGLHWWLRITLALTIGLSARGPHTRDFT